MKQWTGSKLGKDFVKAIVRILSPCLFNFYAEYIMKNAGLDETQAGVKTAGEISTTSDMHMMYTAYKLNKQSDNIQL